MRYLWTEDTGAGLHFWKLVNQLFFDNELVVENKGSNQGLLDALIDLETEDGDEYFVAFDYVVDNQDIRNKYRMLKSITDKSEGKIVILDMICFEYLILAFDKLVEWTGTGKTDKIKIRDKVLVAVENHRIDLSKIDDEKTLQYEKNALNNFKDVLGKYCAINQFVELSKRCFLVEHQNEIQKRDTFVKLATEYAVTLTNYDADSMVCEICRSYIVNVHLCFETFLKDVCRQINKYGKNEYKPRIQEESYLSCAVRNICGNNLSDDMKPLYELCEYYRLIRNTSVHDLCEIDSHEKEYRKLQKYNFKTEAKFSKLVAPNKYEEISFDDFVMFSRSCVELATYIFEKMAYDYTKIALDIPDKQISKWRKYSKNRQEKALCLYIKTLYKVDEEFIEQIPKLLNMIIDPIV